MSVLARLLLGFLAGALSVLTFHQGMIAVLHAVPTPALHVGVAPYRLIPVPPFGVPLLADLAFWGGLYGALFGLVHPKARPALWLDGLLLGVLAMLVGFFIVAPLKHQPIGGDFIFTNWVRSFLINGSFGIGVGLIYPLFVPRRT